MRTWKYKQAITANSNEYTHVVGLDAFGAPNIAIVDTELNARLIAAAPELLTALASLVKAGNEAWERGVDTIPVGELNPLLVEARRAINKAKGE